MPTSRRTWRDMLHDLLLPRPIRGGYSSSDQTVSDLRRPPRPLSSPFGSSPNRVHIDAEEAERRAVPRSELTIEASATIAALHRWPGAPEHRAYLRDLHRHLFKVTAEVEVDHGDRATEFHDLGDVLDRELLLIAEEYHPQARLRSFGARSCEQLAEHLAGELTHLGYTPVVVTVSEDGEHTGIWRAL